MRTLSLTSPLTKGEQVRRAQLRLNGANVFKQDFLKGSVDGEFGEETGRACRRAKYWCGYPERDQTPVYGDLLDGYLHGRKKLPVAFKVRRAARLRAAKQKPLGVKALELAKRYVGVKESPPDSNIVIFSRRYGITGPWCAMFCTCVYVDAGSKAFELGRRWAYVPYIVADAKAGQNGLSLTREPKPGDMVCFDWEGNGVSDHVGLFESWIAGAEGSEFLSLEGNTSLGNDSNGGSVMRRSRSRKNVQAFVRVGR